MLKGLLTEITIRLIHLMDYNIVCYKYNNLRHKACNCRDMKEDAPIIKKEKPTTIWEKKENSSRERL